MTSARSIPRSTTVRIAFDAAVSAAKGVPLSRSLESRSPAEDQETTRPRTSVTVTMVRTITALTTSDLSRGILGTASLITATINVTNMSISAIASSYDSNTHQFSSPAVIRYI
nr:ORF81b [Ipomoea trifida]